MKNIVENIKSAVFFAIKLYEWIHFKYNDKEIFTFYPIVTFMM